MAEGHALLLGKIVGSLQSLETTLRLYLLLLEMRSRNDTTPGKKYWDLKIGDTVAVDPFTNFDQLATLIKKFNDEVDRCGQGTKIDSDVVRIRDLMAHGRVAADAPDEHHLKIIKFDNPKGSQTVRVTDCAVTDDAWFSKNLDFLNLQIKSVGEALGRIGG